MYAGCACGPASCCYDTTFIPNILWKLLWFGMYIIFDTRCVDLEINSENWMYFGRISFLIEGCRCFNRKGQIFGHTLNVKSCLWVLFGSQKQIQISKNNPDLKKLFRSQKNPDLKKWIRSKKNPDLKKWIRSQKMNQISKNDTDLKKMTQISKKYTDLKRSQM